MIELRFTLRLHDEPIALKLPLVDTETARGREEWGMKRSRRTQLLGGREKKKKPIPDGK